MTVAGGFWPFHKLNEEEEEEKLKISKKEAKERFESALAFEKQYALQCMTAEEKLQSDFYDKINNPVMWEDLGKFGESFPLQKILNQLGLKYDQEYVIMTPDYLYRINEVYTEENLEGIKNVILVNYVLDRMARLDWNTYEKLNDIYEEYYHIRDTEEKNEIAYEAVKSNLAAELQRVYVERYLTYEVPLLEGMNYVEASDAIKSYNCEKIYSKCGTKIDFDRWGDDDSFGMFQVNACYYPSANAIYLCAGIWGEPLYSENMKTEELYSSLCADIIGHEISHAFDEMGVQLDVNGITNKWLTAEDEERFQSDIENAKKYLNTIKPFGDYYVKGDMVITEVMADYLGVKCALNMAEKIEGFDYELFFTNYAKLHAIVSTYKKEVSVLSRDEHPLRYLRTNVILQQFDKFYETYSISEADGMYLAPEDRFSFYDGIMK